MSGRRALVSQHRLPEFDRERGSKRVLETIRYLQLGGWEVTYLAINGDAASRYVRHLQQMGVATYVGVNAESEEAIRRFKPEVAVIAFWHAATVVLPLVRRLAPEARVVVDSVDLHFLRDSRRRFNASPRVNAAAPLDADFASALVDELNTYSSADAVLTVSEKEAALVDDLLGRRGFAHAVPLGEEASRSALGFGQRRGILYVGNFRHLPNGEAVEYLCRAVLPRLDPEMLDQHPVSVVGNAMTDEIRSLGLGLPGVHMVGWVPSVEPYLERARLSVVPLLHGAGVKGKLIHSLMVGTPVVTTSVGIEGLDVADGSHVLVGDSPAAFADAMSRVLDDPDLWQHLSSMGAERMVAQHGTTVVARRLLEVIEHVRRPDPRAPSVGAPDERSLAPWWAEEYGHVRQHLPNVLAGITPAGSTVLVVSGGDDELLRADGSACWHFPRGADGNHSGFHPADGDAAVAHLEALRARGAQFLVFPVTARWWLHHYETLNRHLGDAYRLVHDDDVCTVYDLRALDNAVASGNRPKAVVLGVYCAEEAVSAAALTRMLQGSQVYDVSQCWAAIGGAPLPHAPEGVEVHPLGGPVTFEQAIAILLEKSWNIGHEYLVLVSGTVVVPEGFLDDFLCWQERLGLAIAQPACDVGSVPTIPSLGQQFGMVARQTRHVGWHPLVSMHRSVSGSAELDPTRPGELRVPPDVAVGVIDACPVGHLGPQARRREGVTSTDERGDHISRRSTVVGVATAGGGGFRALAGDACGAAPRLSVVIATHNRSTLLAGCLRSFVDQTLATEQWEIVVVDDGSEDDTSDVCARYAALLPLRHVRIDHAGRSSAKNLGALVARGDVVLFFDDDDVADSGLLEEHIRSHEANPDPGLAVLGYTTWAPALEVTPVMHYVTDVGHFLFAYHNLEDGQRLDFRYFWEGRVSCKRRLLLEHGLHDPRLAYTVDIELGYRLGAAGMRVVYNGKAVSYVARPIGFDDFCRRCEAKGRALRQIAGLHRDPVVQAYAGIEGAAAAWSSARDQLEGRITRARQLETLVHQGRDEGTTSMSELHDLYREVFTAFKVKGLVEAGDSAAAAGPQLSVIIPVWDTTAELAEMTARNVSRIWDVSGLELEVIMVDNGSSFRPSCRVTASRRFDENRGVAVAWNTGSRLANSEVLAFVNNDVWVEPGWDVALRQAAMNGRRIAFPFTDHADGVGARRPDQAGTAGWCFALKAELLRELGPFDERFSPAFFEDTDYWHRAWEAGVDLSPVPDAVVRHARRTSARHQPNFGWLFQSHRLKYGWKHGVDPTSAPPFYQRTVVDYRPSEG